MINFIKNNKGFTIPEVILTISILLVISVLSFGDVSTVLTATYAKEEEANMKEIKKALQSFLQDMGQLPEQNGNTLGSGTTHWSQDLAGYTNLSEDQLRFDPWFRERQYKMFSRTEVFRDTTFETYYAVVYSYGEDGMVDIGRSLGTLENLIFTVPPPGDRTAPFINFGGGAADMTTYLNFEAAPPGMGDDQFFKITDRQEKMANYEITSKRLAGIVGALQSYALFQMNFAIANAEANWETKLYYPRSVPQDGGTDPDNATYGDEVIFDANKFLSTGGAPRTVNTVVGTDAQRRLDMVELMRLLGLPDSFCCSAMELGTDNLPLPFYYFSNPRRKVGAVCDDVRGANPVTDIMISPRIVVDTTNACG